ncbi:MAG: hypothetical protein U1A77_09915 [Pirellulales bacterium]
MSLLGETVFTMVRFLICWIVVGLVGLTGCSGGGSGPVKHPVVGRFVVNGTPAEQVAVTFHHADGEKAGEYRYATAVTDQEGRFELSTTGDKDGAVEGTYRVTFSWLSSKDLDAYDMLSGAYSDPSQSKFTVTVPMTGAELPPFELNVPESQIRRPSSRR